MEEKRKDLRDEKLLLMDNENIRKKFPKKQ